MVKKNLLKKILIITKYFFMLKKNHFIYNILRIKKYILLTIGT
jgi:hypothetical protein